MPALRKIVVALLALPLGLSASAFADAVQKPPTHKAHSKKVSEAPLPPYTPQTLAPMPLEQVPAVPPQVAYSNGLLTIVAHNSTLGDILRAVHTQTGAELEIPGNATERVVATLGPGPARDVLATLLNGTHFNYVMLGSASNPAQIQRVVLTAKTGPEAATTAASAQQPVPPQGMMPNRFQQPLTMQQAQNGEGQDAAADDNSADAQDDSTETPPEEQQAEQPGAPGQAPKTPEQLLQELQRQQQQLQQQQQQGQPGQPGQPQIVYPNAPPTGQAPEQN